MEPRGIRNNTSRWIIIIIIIIRISRWNSWFLNSKIRHTWMEIGQRYPLYFFSLAVHRHPILGSRRHEARNKRTFFDYSDFVMGFLDITLVVHSHRRCIVSERVIWGQEPKESLGRRHWLDDITDAMDVSTRVGLYSRVRLSSHIYTHTRTFDHAHFPNGISTYYSMQHCVQYTVFVLVVVSFYVSHFLCPLLPFLPFFYLFLLTYLLTFHHFFRSFNVSVSLSRRFRGDLCSPFFLFLLYFLN